jgi:hypothetical protein
MIVDEDGQRRHVIHVWMRDNHIADALVLRIRERKGDASGVNGDTVVDEKAGQSLLRGGVTLLVKGAGKKLDFHGEVPG